MLSKSACKLRAIKNGHRFYLSGKYHLKYPQLTDMLSKACESYNITDYYKSHFPYSASLVFIKDDDESAKIYSLEPTDNLLTYFSNFRMNLSDLDMNNVRLITFQPTSFPEELVGLFNIIDKSVESISEEGECLSFDEYYDLLISIYNYFNKE